MTTQEKKKNLVDSVLIVEWIDREGKLHVAEVPFVRWFFVCARLRVETVGQNPIWN